MLSYRDTLERMIAMLFADYRILLFAKAPVPGRVKTRLIPHFGASGAARIYRQLTLERIHLLGSAELAPLEIWAAPDDGHRFFRACAGRFGLSVHRQRGVDLGARMDHALQRVLARAAGAVIVGADCASIDGAALQQAFVRLAEGADVVLGPAADGGYVLIGLRRPQPALFRNMPWGTGRVLNLTRERLALAGLRWSELAAGWDVDRPEDVLRWRSTRATGPVPAIDGVVSRPC